MKLPGSTLIPCRNQMAPAKTKRLPTIFSVIRIIPPHACTSSTTHLKAMPYIIPPDKRSWYPKLSYGTHDTCHSDSCHLSSMTAATVFRLAVQRILLSRSSEDDHESRILFSCTDKCVGRGGNPHRPDHNNRPGSRQDTRPRNADHSLDCDCCIAQHQRVDAQIFPGRHAGEL